MKIFIFSLQREITQIISDHLTDKGHLCFPFLMQEDISVTLQNQKKLPDLLILDYMTFNHEIFNIFTYLKTLNLKVPVVFYNDPCLIRSTRSAHWMAIMESMQPIINEKDLSIYTDVLKDLEDLIESEELKPYITLLQPPKQIPLSMVKESYTLHYLKENRNDCIYQFLERSKIPKNIFYLLDLMQKNKDSELTLKDIASLYALDGKTITEESLKVLMSRLRKYIREDKECDFLIYHDENRFKFVRYKS